MAERPGEDRSRLPAPLDTAPGPGERWTPIRLVLWSARYLEEKGVSPGRLDAEHLLAHTLGVGRLQLYLQHDRPLDPEELAAFKPLLIRRAAREPLQYIVGRVPFRELELITDRRALIPRPETEVLTEVVLTWARAGASEPGTLSAVDVGTGTGCIALSLALEGKFGRVLATDVSAAALGLAAENVKAAGGDVAARVELRLGDLLEPLGTERFHVLVSNPPYVREGEREGLQAEVRDFEPRGALFAGPDGLSVIRPLVGGAGEALLSGGLLALEVGASQTDEVVSLVVGTGAFEAPLVHKDLAGRARIVTALRRG